MTAQKESQRLWQELQVTHRQLREYAAQAEQLAVSQERNRLAPAPLSRPQHLPEPLPERELEVLALLAQGLTNREIAGRLHLAEGTVKNYVTNILGKIGARDRTQAALRARELGLLPDQAT